MNKVSQWIQNGAGVEEGLRLLSEYAPDPFTERLVRLNPNRYGYLIRQKLQRFASSEPAHQPPTYQERQKFRQQWPFLADPDCPYELKILAADKITAYQNYVSGHAKLFSCSTLEECFETAKNIIKNYTENRKILSEFTYYGEHRTCLGKHPIFSEMNRLAEVRALPISELFRRKKNLEQNIWRIQSEINKNDKPHLLAEREARLESRRRELRETERLIADYDKRK